MTHKEAIKFDLRKFALTEQLQFHLLAFYLLGL